MIFKDASSRLLSITRSKAKMYEFGLSEEHHIRLTEPPSALLPMTIGMLGDMCRNELVENTDITFIEECRKELRSVAKYFDALVSSKLESHYDYYLCLLGAASYYLADMPGSAAVLSSKLNGNSSVVTESRIELLLEWLLKSDFEVGLGADEPMLPVVKNVARAMTAFTKFQLDGDIKLKGTSFELREYCFANCNDKELLLSDIVAAVVKRKLDNSAINLLPKYTGIPRDIWLPVLSKPTFIKEFWPAQMLLGKAGVFRGKSAVVQLPTSAGKTKSSEIVIRSSFLSGRANVAVVIAPFRSLCREISASLSEAFSGENVLVNQLSDIPQIDEFDFELLTSLFEEAESAVDIKSIIVSTPEKLVYLLRHEPELTNEISLVIYDEGHQFDSGGRGVTYELLLADLKRKLAVNTQHVLISAVLSNAESIGEWLYAEDGVVVDGADCLSTERSVAFSSWRRSLGQFHYVNPLEPNTEEFFVPRVLKSYPIPLRGNETVQRYFPDKGDKTLVAAYLGLKLAEFGAVAVFCGQKSSIFKICREILKPTDRLDEIPVPSRFSNGEEIEKIHSLAKAHFGESSVISKAIQKGVLPHSSNIPNGLRLAVEFAMEHGLGRCVVCTSTLAQGVNLPIKYLVVSGVFQGRKRISTRDFHNLLGRAGRSGKHTEGSVLFTDTELFDERYSTKQWQWSQLNSLLDSTKSERCLSSLLTLVQDFADDEFGVDPIRFLYNPNETLAFVEKVSREEGIDISGILEQAKSRLSYLESLESFLLANSDEGSEIDGDKLDEIISSTLAYSLATDQEKEDLEIVFRMVASRVNSISAPKRAAYGKALLSIDELALVEQWLHENIDLLSESSSIEEQLNIIWPVVTRLAYDNVLGKLIGDSAGLTVARLWCSGISYEEILTEIIDEGFKLRAGTQERVVKIENVVEMCDNGLGYDAMIVIGACADLTESSLNEPEIAKKLRELQAIIKIGLSDECSQWLYAQGIADRVVASVVTSHIRASGLWDGSLNKQMLNKLRGIIEPVLWRFPSVFKSSIY